MRGRADKSMHAHKSWSSVFWQLVQLPWKWHHNQQENWKHTHCARLHNYLVSEWSSEYVTRQSDMLQGDSTAYEWHMLQCCSTVIPQCMNDICYNVVPLWFHSVWMTYVTMLFHSAWLWDNAIRWFHSGWLPDMLQGCSVVCDCQIML